MALPPNVIYTPKNADEIRDAFLSDVRLEAIAQGLGSDDVPVQEGTEWWILGSALGQSMMMLYSNQRVMDVSRSVFDSEGEELDRLREEEGLPVLPAIAATGRIRVQVEGTQTIPNGQAFTLENGARGIVSPQALGASDGQEVEVIMTDLGTQGNAEGGTQVTFIAPPGNLKSTATVSNDAPLSEGRDEEDDGSKRLRIINRRRNRAAAGTWAQQIDVALNSAAGIQYAFVYPGLGGPSSRKIVLIRDIDPELRAFDRAPTEAAVDIVRAALHSALPKETETIVQAAAEEDVDVAVLVSIPDSTGLGGDGTGWIDSTLWPPLDGGDTKVTISAIGTSADSWDIRVDATTSTAPTDGVSHISWWSSVDQQFRTARIESASGGTTAWNLKLDVPFADSNGDTPQVGDYISPGAAFIEAYGETFRDAMRVLGPGENTADANKLPRAKRHPFIERREWPADLNARQIKALLDGHKEISDVSWSYRSLSTPTVPANVALPPNILKLRHFGIYEL